jgi:hypothetical protein
MEEFWSGRPKRRNGHTETVFNLVSDSRVKYRAKETRGRSAIVAG